MKSNILQTATQFLIQAMLIISVTFVLRGHNEPGGGFIGGLVAASGIALYLLAFGVTSLTFKKRMQQLLSIGLVILLFSVVQGYFLKDAILAGSWFGKVGTPLVFDFGIYFIVIGSISWLIVLLEERWL